MMNKMIKKKKMIRRYERESKSPVEMLQRGNELQLYYQHPRRKIENQESISNDNINTLKSE